MNLQIYLLLNKQERINISVNFEYILRKNYSLSPHLFSSGWIFKVTSLLMLKVYFLFFCLFVDLLFLQQVLLVLYTLPG